MGGLWQRVVAVPRFGFGSPRGSWGMPRQGEVGGEGAQGGLWQWVMSHCDITSSPVCQQNVPKLVAHLHWAWVSSPKIFRAGVLPQQRGVPQILTFLEG